MEQQQKVADIMKYEATLPVDFNGVFTFTNWSDEDFVGRWGSKDYLFPAEASSPMLMPEFSPVEVQHIRKKFAKDLAEREFFKTTNYKRLLKQERNDDGSVRLNGMHSAGTYSLDELATLIQHCLKPLQVKKAEVKITEKPLLEDKLSRDEEGNLNTEAIDKKASLKEKALRK